MHCLHPTQNSNFSTGSKRQKILLTDSNSSTQCNAAVALNCAQIVTWPDFSCMCCRMTSEALPSDCLKLDSWRVIWMHHGEILPLTVAESNLNDRNYRIWIQFIVDLLWQTIWIRPKLFESNFQAPQISSSFEFGSHSLLKVDFCPERLWSRSYARIVVTDFLVIDVRDVCRGHKILQHLRRVDYRKLISRPVLRKLERLGLVVGVKGVYWVSFGLAVIVCYNRYNMVRTIGYV